MQSTIPIFDWFDRSIHIHTKAPISNFLLVIMREELPTAQMDAVLVHMPSHETRNFITFSSSCTPNVLGYRHCVVCAPRGIHVRVTSMLRLILAPGVSGTSTRALTLAVSSPESSSYASLNLEK